MRSIRCSGASCNCANPNWPTDSDRNCNRNCDRYGHRNRHGHGHSNCNFDYNTHRDSHPHGNSYRNRDGDRDRHRHYNSTAKSYQNSVTNFTTNGGPFCLASRYRSASGNCYSKHSVSI